MTQVGFETSHAVLGLPFPERCLAKCSHSLHHSLHHHSISSVADQGEDDISLPSARAEDDNETTRAAGSDPRTLVPEDDKSQENFTSKDGIKCHTSAIERQPDLRTKSDPVEEPKPVWTKNRKRAFSHFLLMHFAPVATTLVLFWLYLKGFQWRASDVQLKALLFAAKLRKPKSFSSHNSLSPVFSNFSAYIDLVSSALADD